MTMRGTYRTLTGTPVPITEREQTGYKAGKTMLSVDFESGEINWDEEMENKLKPKTKLDLNKDDFLKAIKNNKSQAGAIKELGIGSGTFYKYKKIWAADIAEIEKRGGKRVNVLEALDMMNEAREESNCVTTIFDQRISITPEVRRVLENHQNESEMIVDEIGQKLGELTIEI